MFPENVILHSRLRNCLQTILDLEPAIRLAPLGDHLMEEFGALKEVMGRLEDISVNEDEVGRIEEATANFLCELKEALSAIDVLPPHGERLQ